MSADAVRTEHVPDLVSLETITLGGKEVTLKAPQVVVRGEKTVAIAYDVSGNPEYIGKATPGLGKSEPGWQIKKLTWADGKVTDIQWAGGNRAYAHIWDDRASVAFS